MIGLDKMGMKPGAGSARSIPGVNLHEALAVCGDFLVSHGGHAAAAGLKIEPGNIAAFRAAFCDAISSQMENGLEDGELTIDAEAPFSEFTLQTVRQIERLAPFGQNNARPLLCATDVTLAEPPKAIGNGGHHLSLKLSQYGVTFRAVGFGCGDRLDELLSVEGSLDVAFRPVINAFRGRQSVELHLVDWKAKF